MRPLLDDLSTAFRSLRQRPGFTAVVVLTLAVALGANSAVFGVLEQTLLRPLPFDGADEMVYLFRENSAQGFRLTCTLDQLRAWREGTDALETVEPFEPRQVTLLGHGEPRLIDAARARPGLFELLGVRPVLGSGLAPDPGEDGSRRVVLGERLWNELFDGSPRALGAALRLDEEVYTVAGVVGPELRRLPPAGKVDLWLPFPPRTEPHRTSVYALARLAPGVSAEAAEERIVAVERHRVGDDEVAAWRPEVIRPADFFSQFLGRQLLVIQFAVGLMLLIGCANVGNLFLVRAAGRRQEIAVRGALGAGRWRIVRTLMLEALLVAGAGAVLGLLIALWGGRVLTRMRDWTFIELDGLRLDPALFAFAAGSALLATLAFGLVPALSASRSDLGYTLRAAAPGGGSGGGSRARSLLAVAEVALSLVLLVGAGLVTKRFVTLLDTGTGFRLEGLVAVSADLPDGRYASPEIQAAFLADLREGLNDLERSGVETALASGAPTNGGITFGVLHAEGAPEPPDSQPPENLGFVAVGSGYFRTAGIPILEGRAIEEGDIAAATVEEGDLPVVINRRLADRLWHDGSPVGRRFTLGAPSWYRVVGVAADASQLGIGGDFPFQLYTPLHAGQGFAVLVRSDEPRSTAVVEQVVSRIHRLDPALPLRSVRTVEEIFRDSLSAKRFQSTLMSVFAVVALLLAGLGVYAVLAFSVRRRSFEIGVRAALGARPGQVLALIGRQGAAIAVAGLVRGTAGARAAARLLGHLLGEVSPHDPVVYALAAAVLLAACAGAVLVPATRAARLDPVRVLRRE
jgi:predicted permease